MVFLLAYTYGEDFGSAFFAGGAEEGQHQRVQEASRHQVSIGNFSWVVVS
jgi:hypothetical protein